MRLLFLTLLLAGCADHVEVADADAGDPRTAECLDAREQLREVGCGVPDDDALWLQTCLGWLGDIDTACIAEADDCIAANRCVQ